MDLRIEVRDVPERDRYEAVSGTTVAGHIDYGTVAGARTFRHTEVAPEFEGRGVGGTLARGALDDLRSRGLTVRPACSFVAGWIRRHPDYLDIVAEDYRDRIAGG
jgi:predicted GNAT family acetyltransferase